MSNPPWDSMRVALAVWQHGSLSRAGRALKMDPTTVGRRVTALELALGCPLFLRSNGWVATPVGLRVFEAGRRASDAMQDAFRAGEQGLEARGIVRITAIEAIATSLLAPVLPAFYAQHPEIELHLVCTSRVLELGRGQADIAIRIGEPDRHDGVARRVTRVRERAYAAAAFLEASGLDPLTLDRLDGLPVLSIGPRPPDLLDPNGVARQVLRSNSVSTVLAATRAGLGVALLPDVLASPPLVPLPLLPSFDDLPVWMVAHRDLVHVPRVRVALDFFGQESIWNGSRGTAE